jgi:pimeloyl-ACP methyl ester carboxylesterase
MTPPGFLLCWIRRIATRRDRAVPHATVNDVSLFYELTGNSGLPMALVHGSWSDHHGFDRVLAGLAESFRVLAYDRRGHSQSARPETQGSVREDGDDLAALLERLDMSPAHAVASSFGGVIALNLATVRPNLFRSIVAHEPPLRDVLPSDNPLRPAADVATARAARVAEQAEADPDKAARDFVEEVAFGPGSWDQLPRFQQETFVRNAPTFTDERRDPRAGGVDVERLKSIPLPILLTKGETSPPYLQAIVEVLAASLPRAEVKTYRGAGHAPQSTHAEEYVTTVTEFAKRTDRSA